MKNAATREYKEEPIEVPGGFAYQARCSDCGLQLAVVTRLTDEGAVYTADMGFCCGPCYGARE